MEVDEQEEAGPVGMAGGGEEPWEEDRFNPAALGLSGLSGLFTLNDNTGPASPLITHPGGGGGFSQSPSPAAAAAVGVDGRPAVMWPGPQALQALKRKRSGSPQAQAATALATDADAADANAPSVSRPPAATAATAAVGPLRIVVRQGEEAAAAAERAFETVAKTAGLVGLSNLGAF
jgi:hypothetical protein